MKVFKWSPDFKPQVKTFSKILSVVGIVVAFDVALHMYSKSRGNVAKIKVEIDLLEPKLDQIWLGYNMLDDTGGIGFGLIYEDVVKNLLLNCSSYISNLKH
ncbi:hypothetical protein H5410_035744 [Solanum commersonii]|uniref:Uncharacterized protein n=1 Tax=Solanum commersonii TaxID=4109 RepID=A0A9J5Y4K6_SOLCO|nr:hypothetical protein H5410_035744 [Solanum commersonii]